MSKNRVENTGATPDTATSEQPVVAATVPEAAPNFTLTFKRNHPQDRCSYGIAGNPGIVVFQRGLFKGAQPFTSNTDLGGLPATITLSCEMVQPKADNKAQKAELAAQKAAERAAKAAAKIEAAQKRAAEKAAKAEAALAAAKAKIEAAQAAAAAKVS